MAFPIVTQPGATVMYPPDIQPMAAIPGCPPGLEILTQLDRLVVKQKVELLEAFTGFETKNKYQVLAGNGQPLFYAFEESGCCSRQCCGPRRGYTMHIVNNTQQEVMRVQRDFKCCAGGMTCLAVIPCCAHESLIEAPVGQKAGSIIQTGSCCNTAFFIRDANDQNVFSADGPCCLLMDCCQNKEFPLVTMSGATVGSITKNWSGFAKELFTDADNFTINFPIDLDVRMKATLLGSLFLVDFVEFEKLGNRNDN